MNAAIYARKSTDQSDVSDAAKSVTRQIEQAKAYAARKGWAVADAHVYADDGISGAEFANRPGFLRLMNALKPRPGFGVLIMSEESRLGREQIETSYSLKQILQAGVRVFYYLEDRERTLGSPTDKLLMSVTAFADELEREKARQRTYDALSRLARAGHVTGGSCYGYRNVEVIDADGRRSHVERTIEPAHAEVIRRIFQLCADGRGVKAIAKLLNDEGAPSPRAQQGRSRTWAPNAVWSVLRRPLYRGAIVWNQTRKRDKWGQHHQADRPEGEWIHVAAPQLRIVSEDLWQAAHARLEVARSLYFAGTKGRPFGRPADGSPSPYLLTNFATCGCCGGGLQVHTRSQGATRSRWYGCSAYHERGRKVCTNAALLPMADGNAIVIESLLDDVLDKSMIRDAIEGAVSLIQNQGAEAVGHVERIARELEKVERERSRLVTAIADGGQLAGLLDGLRERETRRASLESERQTIAARGRSQAADTSRLRNELTELADEWRTILVEDPESARPVIHQLLDGRVTFLPVGKGRWKMTGRGTLAGLFGRELFTEGLASPSGKGTFGIPLSRLFRAA